MVQQEEQRDAMLRETEEIYLNTKQVCKLQNVYEDAFDPWAKCCYFVPVKVAARICMPNPMYAVYRQ
uniref:hypothetical protein n=1 Tax=Bacteroides stercoris TaxID=46506 RepID=UPI003565B4CA